MLLIPVIGCVGASTAAAEATESHTQCQRLENPYTRARCYTQAAIAQADARICDALDETLSGREHCIVAVALAERRPSVCDRLAGTHARTLCYRRVGDLTGDYSSCDKLESRAFRNACRPKGVK
jgi:hypothetical protein